MKTKSNITRLLMIIGLIMLTNSCFFRVGKVKEISPAYIVNKDKAEDYLIVHYDNEAWNLINTRSENDQIIGKKQNLIPIHKTYLKTEHRTQRVYSYKSSELFPTNETHIYVNKVVFKDDGEVIIDVNDVTKMEVYDGAGYITAAIGVGTAAAAFGVFLIIACSCPSVYFYDSIGYAFQGGVFPGAINAALERDDYLVINGLSPPEDNYVIKLVNEKPETQYINLADLIVVEHDAETEVLFSKYGELLTFSDLQSPKSALTIEGMDIKNKLFEKDLITDSFNHPGSNDGINEIILEFDKPVDTHQGKLMLRAKNSNWMDHIFLKFFNQMGDYYDDFQRMQSEKSLTDRQKWMREQGVVMNVYLDNGRGWEYYDYFNVVGSPVFKDIGMNLDLSGIEGDVVRIKLESGFGFWELDYVGLDFDYYKIASETTYQPVIAIGKNEINHINELLKADNVYVSALETGEELYLEFPKHNNISNMETTIVFHSRGYYELNLDIQGKADLAYLKKFRKKGRFSQFSEEEYHNILHRITSGN